MSVDHYENFPVASIVVPRQYRRPIEIIYAFARSADDFADEGSVSDVVRLANLDRYWDELERIQAGQTPSLPLFHDLAAVIKQFDLPTQLFFDLLTAFKQDVVKHRYDSFGELIQYCRHSANPVGRLLLHLFGQATPQNLAMSDGICTALQLINFWQDIAIDWQKGRVYLPQEDLLRFQVTEAHIAGALVDERWKTLLRFEIERTKKMLEAGSPLGLILKGRLGIEIRMIALGGERILKHLWEGQGDVFQHRPVLVWQDWLYILRRGFAPRLFKS